MQWLTVGSYKSWRDNHQVLHAYNQIYSLLILKLLSKE
jgi:hypothetical protein